VATDRDARGVELAVVRAARVLRLRQHPVDGRALRVDLRDRLERALLVVHDHEALLGQVIVHVAVARGVGAGAVDPHEHRMHEAFAAEVARRDQDVRGQPRERLDDLDLAMRPVS
jgi:hypothetical protein